MKTQEIKLPSNKKFGYFFSLIFLLISGYLLSKNLILISTTFFLLALIFLIITFLRSELLLPLNKAWLKFGIFLGKIISPIVLGLIFFFLITPVGLITRAFGRDELSLKKINRESDWKVINKNKNYSTSFKNQF